MPLSSAIQLPQCDTRCGKPVGVCECVSKPSALVRLRASRVQDYARRVHSADARARAFYGSTPCRSSAHHARRYNRSATGRLPIIVMSTGVRKDAAIKSLVTFT